MKGHFRSDLLPTV